MPVIIINKELAVLLLNCYGLVFCPSFQLAVALLIVNEITSSPVISTGMGDRRRGAYHLVVTSHPGQFSLLPSAGREMSTGKSAVIGLLCSLGN